MLRVAYLALFVLAAQPAAAQTRLPSNGGEGGGPFDAFCPAGAFLRGLELRTGDDVDAARPICARPGPSGLYAEAAEGPWRGGTGGEVRQLLCPADRPAVVEMAVQAEGQETVIVNNVHLFCGAVNGGARPGSNAPADARFDGPLVDTRGSVLARFSAFYPFKHAACPPGQIGSGIYGRHGIWLDSLGLVCSSALASAARTGIALGRRRLGDSPSPPRPPLPPCVVAKAYRVSPYKSATKTAIITQRCIDSIQPDETSRCGRAKRAYGTEAFNRLYDLCLDSIPDA